MLGAMLLMMVACSHGGDEPEPKPNPDPDTPTDPYADIAEDWREQKPFFILTEVNSAVISNLTEDGFLYDTGYGRNNAPYWTQCKEQLVGAPGMKYSEKNFNKPFDLKLKFDGVKATPFVNRKAYETVCLEMGIRPETESPNSLPALDTLRTYPLYASHMMDYVQDIQVICKQVWFADVKAGESLVNEDTDVIYCQSEYNWITWHKTGYKNPDNPRPDPRSNYTYYPMSVKDIAKYTEWHTYVHPEITISVVLADEPGIYDMILKVKLHGGYQVELPFKIRVEPEGYTE